MDMKARIYKHLKGLVAIPSVSNTQEEKAAAEYLAGSLAEQAYFKKNPQLCGQFPLEGDMLGRSAVYGLVTVSYTHLDVYKRQPRRRRPAPRLRRRRRQPAAS